LPPPIPALHGTANEKTLVTQHINIYTNHTPQGSTAEVCISNQGRPEKIAYECSPEVANHIYLALIELKKEMVSLALCDINLVGTYAD